MKQFYNYLMFITLLSFTHEINAQNNCGVALPITVNGPCLSGSVSNGTDDAPLINTCSTGLTFRRDRWYTFTVSGGPAAVTIVGTTTNQNLLLQLIGSTGSCAGLSTISCANANNATNSPQTETITTGPLANGIYYIKVVNIGNNNNMNLSSLCVTASPPSNNSCITATTLPCGTTNMNGTTFGTNGSTNHNTGCSISNNGVWYTFTGDGSTTTITSTANGSFDHQMAIASGSCLGLTNITCQDSGIGGGTESYTFNTTLGTTYFVYIANWDAASNATGSFTVSRTCVAPPANDNCSGAITLTPATNCTYATYTTLGASNSVGPPAPGCASYAGGDVWFRVTVPASGILSIDTQTGGITDSGMAVYSGTCGGLTLVTCDDDSSANGLMSSINLTGQTPGATLFIRVWEYGNDSPGTFGICVTTPGPPVNDSCATAVALNTNPTTFCTSSTSGTTVLATNSSAGCVGNADDDVWYTFEAYETSHTVTVTPGTLANAVLQVYSGSCLSLTSLACINATTGSLNETTTLTGLTVGATYYIRVYSFANGIGQGTFSICVTTACTPGGGVGTNSTGCPTNVAGGLGLGGVDPAPITTCGASTCTTLEATYKNLGDTTNYTVESIPYAPPYQFGCLANSVSINVDDVWSGLVSIPFNFCYYGNTYNQMLIGSNGVVSFNTTNNTPGGYNNWAFSTNLPSPSLFLNTIFGAYHDIDPSVGGEVGWELVTMPSGCRAMIIGWNEVPMFSFACNNLMYTGMIVLYENTNIIEVYIKEKRVCASWNSGNAVIGIQNNAGTAGVVAPNRNSLDPDWTTTNEAWRFMPAGPSITTITWFEGVGTSGPVVGTSPTLTVCPNQTTTYTARIRYTFCNGVIMDVTDDATITVNSRKIWNGSVDTDWNKVNNWTPNTSIPNNADCVIIPVTANNPVISGSSYHAFAGNLIVQTGATLTVNASNTITVTDWVNVQTGAQFNLLNNSSLVQINNVANTGSINYTRNANIRRQDYVYWSSPVAGFSTSNIGAPTTSGLIWRWNPTIANPNGGQGNWEMAVGNTMTAGRGYIVRGPDSFGNVTPQTLVNTFTGVPNNGNITTAIARGSDTNTAYHTGLNGTEITNYSDNWNLVGNPYPSAIRASQFLFNNRTKIMGNIKIWTHGTLPSQIASPFYNTYIYNYSPGDYLTYNFTGTSCCPAAASDYFIGAGQGFFVQMIDGPATTDTVAFNNGLRSNTFDNTNFYRSSDYIIEPPVNVELERHRFWLDIVNSSRQSERTLVGYVQSASNGKDNFFDSNTAILGSMSIFSLIDTEKFQIQGRALPFNPMDEVPVGFHAPAGGQYHIALAAVDGMFADQDIFIRDKDLNVVHNLKVSPYRFTTTAGTRLNRFIIIYSNGMKQSLAAEDEVTVITQETIQVSSAREVIASVTVLDMLGRVIGQYDQINASQFEVPHLTRNQTPLLVQTRLANGIITATKIIF